MGTGGRAGPDRTDPTRCHSAVRDERTAVRGPAPAAGHRPDRRGRPLLRAVRRASAARRCRPWWPVRRFADGPGSGGRLVARLVAGTADSDIRRSWATLGIGYLWVTGATEDITSRIDNTPGLGLRAAPSAGTVWQLSPPCLAALSPQPTAPAPSRRRTPPATIPAGRIGPPAADRRGRGPAVAGDGSTAGHSARSTTAGSRRSRCRPKAVRLTWGIPVAQPAGCCSARALCCWWRPCWLRPECAGPRCATRPSRPGRAATLSELV